MVGDVVKHTHHALDILVCYPRILTYFLSFYVYLQVNPLHVLLAFDYV